MNRKRAVVSIGLLVAVVLLVAGIAASLKYRPTFYRVALAEQTSPEVRREQAKTFVQTTLQLVDAIRHDDRWSREFTEEAVNGWLAEELPAKYSEWLPPDVSTPRIKFDRGVLRIAFESRRGVLGAVISGQVRPWVTGPNQLALEIESARVGMVPVPADEILGDFVKNMNTAGWRMEWKSTGAKDVLVIDLDGADLPLEGGERPVLESVDLGPRLLRISGRRSAEIARLPASRPAL
jgi:hypothetical protein